MRILHVIAGLDVGGAETMLAKLVAEMPRSHETRVVSLTSDGPVGARIRALGIETASLGMRAGVPDPRGVVRLAREIRRFRPDLVQTWMYHADLIGGLAAVLAGRPPVVWGLRNAALDATTAKWTTRRTLRACALFSRLLPATIVSCSDTAREFHVGEGYDASKMVVIPNGFDVEKLRPRPEERGPVRRELSIPEDARVVGIVARFHPMKDLRTFAAAAGRVSAATWFVLCGEGMSHDNAELRGWLAEAGVLDRTRLLDLRDDVPRVLAALDLFTLSSATEGFPNVLGEAMASGIPCVATRVGDCPAIVGDTGRIVAPGDARSLAAAWDEILALPPEERAALGARARQRVRSRFSIASVTARYMQLYDDVVGGSGAVP